MKIFVISMEKSKERRAIIAERLNQLGLSFEFYDAIDGHSLTESEIILSTREPNYAIERGEVGCSLSHLSVYAKMVALNISSALIIEDDAILSQELPCVLEQLEKRAYDKPLITLLTQTDQFIASPLLQLGNTYCVHRFIEGTGAYGYIINNKAAKKLINFLYPVWLVSDRWQFIRENNICDTQCIVPSVISHPPYEKDALYKISTIHSGVNLSNIKNNIWKKIKKKRPIKIKLQRILWLIFTRRFLKIVRNS